MISGALFIAVAWLVDMPVVYSVLLTVLGCGCILSGELLFACKLGKFISSMQD